MTSPAWTPVGVGGGNNYVRYAHTPITITSQLPLSSQFTNLFSPLKRQLNAELMRADDTS